jgi:hypothetical protein
MLDDTETFATFADEIRLVAMHEANRMLPKDPQDPNARILRRRLDILAKVETLLRRAHDAGRRPT